MNEEQPSQPVQESTSKKKPIIIALVVLVLLAGTGYVVYAWQQNRIQALNDQIKDLQKQVKDAASESKKPTVSVDTSDSGVNYLVIKEWGVKVPQTPSGNVLSYQITGEMADFVSSGQKALGGTCGQFSTSRYHVTRKSSSYKPTSNEVIDNQLRNAAHKVTVGNYTYYVIGDMSGGVCDDKQKVGESISQAEQTANTDLLNALKGLVAS